MIAYFAEHRKQQDQQKPNCIYSAVIKVDRFR